MIPILALARRAFPRTGIGALLAVAALHAAPAAAADVTRGGSLYGRHCAVCHGAGGSPVMPGVPNFKRLESLMKPDQQLLIAIRNGKGAMPGYFGLLRDNEILDVVAFLRTLS